ncbi:MAG TPA: DsrE family protein [Candidatus Dormibacteraeota bacterium]|nr:DsrE family protein [Candidatus Dormibacteraeota bacterium]
MTTLIILNDPPYGTERSYNGLRLAASLARRSGQDVLLFLIGDAAACAQRGQRVPSGYYNIETMLQTVSRHGGTVGVCGSCMDARGIGDDDLTQSARRSSMDELTDWTQQASKVLVF